MEVDSTQGGSVQDPGPSGHIMVDVDSQRDTILEPPAGLPAFDSMSFVVGYFVSIAKHLVCAQPSRHRRNQSVISASRCTFAGQERTRGRIWAAHLSRRSS